LYYSYPAGDAASTGSEREQQFQSMDALVIVLYIGTQAGLSVVALQELLDALDLGMRVSNHLVRSQFHSSTPANRMSIQVARNVVTPLATM